MIYLFTPSNSIKMVADFKNIFDLIKAFPTEQDCINHLERLRWNGNVISPFDE